ncbi:protein containing Formate-tetrahydrofolate ligase, FTHFS domain protein [human gut metagenome]|uniref:Protein containing Formate-tetrahydrofolate ligase, FTHFS domain protein n=1 Tax=human gut metagenome TaxID=408170 RepID=K1TY80_9ZZZZ
MCIVRQSGANTGIGKCSSDPKAYGVAKDFELKVRDIIINNGAEMIVVVMGEIMRMPGLPKEPQARHIDIVNGLIEGLS